MRLLTRKIHRAFPELDSYDDEHCERFIKSARSNPWVMLLHTGVILAVTLPLLLLGIIGAAWLSDKWRVFEYGDVLTWRLLMWLPTGGLVLMVGPVAGYIVRDVLLRRRIVFVLRTRGGCPGCGYSVIGLAVKRREDGHSVVKCPECGAEVEVDASLAELARSGREGGDAAAAVAGGGATGRVFIEGQKLELQVFWTAKRKRLVRRVVLTLLTVVGGGGVLTLSINEAMTRWTASTARSEMAMTRAKLRSLAAAMGNPAGTAAATASSGSSVWERLVRARIVIDDVDRLVWRDQPNPTGTWVYPEFAFIERPELIDPDPKGVYSSHETPEQNRASEALARRMLSEYAKAGVFATLAEAAGSSALAPPDSEFDEDPRSFPGQDRVTAVRVLMRMLRGRMAVAAERGDKADFIASIDALMAISRACAAYPRGFEQLLAAASENSAASGVRLWLLPPKGRPRPDLSWIPDVQAALERGRPPLQFASALDGDRLWADLSVQAYFSNPENFRWGRLSTAFRSQIASKQNWRELIETLMKTRLGTYRENMTELDAFYTSFIPAVTGEGANRQAPFASSPPFELGLLRGIAGSPYYIAAIDETHASRRGTDLWLAIERCRVETGAYPEKLLDLVPGFIPAIPADPWSGGSPMYKRLQTPDELGRGFLLYFVGKDLSDEGGSGGPTSTPWSAGAARDFVVNDPSR